MSTTNLQTIVLQVKADVNDFNNQVGSLRNQAQASITEAHRALGDLASARTTALANTKLTAQELGLQLRSIQHATSQVAAGMKGDMAGISQELQKTTQKLAQARSEVAGLRLKIAANQAAVHAQYRPELDRAEMKIEERRGALLRNRIEQLKTIREMEAAIAQAQNNGGQSKRQIEIDLAKERNKHLDYQREMQNLAYRRNISREPYQHQIELARVQQHAIQTNIAREMAGLNSDGSMKAVAGIAHRKAVAQAGIAELDAARAEEALAKHEASKKFKRGSTTHQRFVLNRDLAAAAAHESRVLADHEAESWKQKWIVSANRGELSGIAADIADPFSRENLIKDVMESRSQLQHGLRKRLGEIEIASKQAGGPHKDRMAVLKDGERAIGIKMAEFQHDAHEIRSRYKHDLSKGATAEARAKAADAEIRARAHIVSQQTQAILHDMQKTLAAVSDSAQETKSKIPFLGGRRGGGSGGGGSGDGGGGGNSSIWSWRGAMLGGLASSIPLGRTGSLIGGLAGGLGGIPGAIAGTGLSFALGGVMQFLSMEADVASAALSKLTDVGMTAAQAGVQLAIDWERVSTTFEVISGNANQGAQMLSDLREMAVKTPYTLSNLTQGGQMLLGMDVDPEQVVPTLGKLTELAAGDPARLDRITLAYGQVMAQGRLQGQELRQFTELGVGVKDFAETMGVGTGVFRDRMEQGRVSVDTVTQTLNRLTSAGGRFFQMNERQLGTIGGKWNQLRETMEIILEKHTAGFMKGFDVPGQLERLLSLITEFRSGSSIDFFEGLGKSLKPIGDLAMLMPGQLGNIASPLLKNYLGIDGVGGLGDILTNQDKMEEGLIMATVKLSEFTNWMAKANLHLAMFGESLVRGAGSIWDGFVDVLTYGDTDNSNRAQLEGLSDIFLSPKYSNTDSPTYKALKELQNRDPESEIRRQYQEAKRGREFNKAQNAEMANKKVEGLGRSLGNLDAGFAKGYFGPEISHSEMIERNAGQYKGWSESRVRDRAEGAALGALDLNGDVVRKHRALIGAQNYQRFLMDGGMDSKDAAVKAHKFYQDAMGTGGPAKFDAAFLNRHMPSAEDARGELAKQAGDKAIAGMLQPGSGRGLFTGPIALGPPLKWTDPSSGGSKGFGRSDFPAAEARFGPGEGKSKDIPTPLRLDPKLAQFASELRKDAMEPLTAFDTYKRDMDRLSQLYNVGTTPEQFRGDGLFMEIARARGDFDLINKGQFEFGQVEAVKTLQKAVQNQGPHGLIGAAQFGSSEAAGMIAGQTVNDAAEMKRTFVDIKQVLHEANEQRKELQALNKSIKEQLEKLNENAVVVVPEGM